MGAGAVPTGFEQLFCNGVVDPPPSTVRPFNSLRVSSGPVLGRTCAVRLQRRSHCLQLEGVGCLKCWGFYKFDLAAAAATGHFNELINIFLKECCWFIVFLSLVVAAGVAKWG